LVDGLVPGANYMNWPDHYVAEHLSDDMRRWAALSGGLPFGRLSNQVSEHMNKVMKDLLEDHTQDGVDCQNMNRSKFKQVLRWLGIERFFPDDLAIDVLRKAHPCPKCTAEGRDLSGDRFHCRVTNKKCPFWTQPRATAIEQRFIEGLVSASGGEELEASDEAGC
jgi:hypothetical protein